MESSVAKETAAGPEASSPVRMFRYSENVDVGAGAKECQEGPVGTCANPLHFHAWCRLPNQFQHERIRDKAQAAKARRLRLLGDEESDARLALEAELDSVRGDRDGLIEELCARYLVRDQAEALRDLREMEEYKTIAQDSERVRELTAMPSAEVDQQELEELTSHLEEFGKALREKVTERQHPFRDSLADKPDSELLDLVRKDRTMREADARYQEEYALWEVYVCTLRPVGDGGVPSERVFSSKEELEAAAPEVIEALNDVFEGLEAAANSGAAEGN